MVIVSAKHSGPLTTRGTLRDLFMALMWHSQARVTSPDRFQDPDGVGRRMSGCVGHASGSPSPPHPACPRAPDQESLCPIHARRKGMNSLRRGPWSRSGVRGRGEMGHRARKAYVFRYTDQHVLNYKCS